MKYNPNAKVNNSILDKTRKTNVNKLQQNYEDFSSALQQKEILRDNYVKNYMQKNKLSYNEQNVYKADAAFEKEYKTKYNDLYNELKGYEKQYQKDHPTQSLFDMGLGVLASGADLATDIGEGFLRSVEGVTDWGAYRIGDVADFLGLDQFANKARGLADFDSTGTWFGKNQNEQQNVFGNWTKGIEEKSVFNDTFDQIFQGIGNVGALAGTAYLTGGSTLGTIFGSYTSAYGNARSEAKRNGASDRDANRAGIINGFAEAISEQFFDALPGMKVEGWGNKATGWLSDKTAKYFGTGAGKATLKVMDSLGEGAEEIISNSIQAVATDLMHNLDKNYTYGMENLTGDAWQDFLNQWTSQESWDAFFSAAMTSALINGGKAVIDTRTQNQIINAYAKDNNMSFQDAKYILTGQQEVAQAEIERDVQAKEQEEYNSKAELEEQAKNRVLNYMQTYTGQNIETEINNRVNEIIKEQNLELTEEEKKDLTKQIRASYEDSLNSANRYRTFEIDDSKMSDKDKSLYKSFQESKINNTKEAHNLYEIMKTLQDNNKTSNYQMVTNESLQKMEGLQKIEGTINGFKKGDTIYINKDAANPYQTVIGHEIGEAIKSSDPDSYKGLRDLVMQVYGEGNLDEYRKTYQVKEGEVSSNLTDDIVDEYVNDKLGEMLESEKLVNRIANNENLLQRLINEVKRLVKYVTSSSEKKQIMKLEKTLEDKYIELYKKADFTVGSEQAQYSISQDSQGRELSKQQQEYFKDSKVRDNEGRLLEVKHVSNNNFNEFKGSNVTIWENGVSRNESNNLSYFTNNEDYINGIDKLLKKGDMFNYSYDKQFKKSKKTYTYNTYLNIVNPLDLTTYNQQNTPRQWQQILKDNGIELTDEEISNYSSYNMKYDSKAWDYNDTNFYQMIKNATNEFTNKLKSAGYDGIVYYDRLIENNVDKALVYVTTNPNQIKNIDNTNPTTNEDIRYSLTEANYNSEELEAIKKQMPKFAGMTKEQLGKEYVYASDSYAEMTKLANDLQKEYKEFQKTPEFMDALQNYKFDSEVWKKGDNYADKIRYYNKEAQKYFAQREAINSLLMDSEQDTRSAKQIVKDAEKHFGTTNDFKETAYITTNGKQLDFSGAHEGGQKGSRSLDHRQINEIDTDMDSFINMGNIRVLPESGGINLAIEPNTKQYSMLRDYIEYAKQNNDEIYVDVDTENGTYDSARYNKNTPTSTIINDIKQYFATGQFPQKSEYADFYYSLSKNTNKNTQYGNINQIQTYQDYIDSFNIPQQIEESNLSEDTKEQLIEEQKTSMEEKRRKLADKRFNKLIENQTYKSLNAATKIAKSYLDFNQKQTQEFKDKLTKLAKMPKDNLIKAKNYEQVRDVIKQYANKDYTFIDKDIKQAQKDIRNTELIVSDDLKDQIVDWSDFRKSSGLNIRKGAKSNVDTIYEEMSSMYPEYLDRSITNYADQLQELSDFVKRDAHYTEHYELNDDSINNITNKVWEKLSNNALTKQEIDDLQTEITKRAEARTREVVREDLLDQMDLNENDIQVGNDVGNIAFQRTDPRRLNEKVFGREVGQKINDATVEFVRHQEAERTRFLNNERQQIEDLGIKPRSKESAAVQKWGEKQYVNDKGELVEYNDNNLMSEFKDQATIEKIKNAAEFIRNKYDTYLDRINQSLEEMGYDPIPKRQDYFMHFAELEDKLSKWGIPYSAENMSAEDLSTDINGLTDQFKPGKNFFAQAMQRKGVKTTYDAITGIDKYLEGASNLMYHTESIQRYRALSKLIRDTYGQTHGLDDIDSMSDEQKAQRLQDVYNNKLTKYAAWLDEQANALAGKKGGIDRAAERLLGRKVYTGLNAIKSQVGSNMTGYNVRSAMTNFASAVQGASKTNKWAFLKGTMSTLRNIIHDDGLINKSDFLTTRFGSDMLSKKAWQKASAAGQIFMSGTDYFTANQIWRGKYYEGLQHGLTEQAAIKNADDFASRIMGDRSKGQTAEIFNSKTLGLLTQFQLEVNNQWSSMIHDNKMALQEGNGAKVAASITFQLGQLYAMSWMFNNFMKALTGSDVMFDPIDLLMKLFDPDDDKTIEEKAQGLLGDVVNQLPMASVFTGGRIPISEAFAGVDTGFKYLTGQKDKYGNAYTLEDVKNDLIGSAAYYLFPTGYGQLKKTTQGLMMYDENLPIAGSYTNSGRLRFEADTSTGGKIQAALFGRNASANAREYYDKGYNTLTEKQIDEVVDLNVPVSEYRQIDKGLKEAKAEAKASGESQTEAQVDYIYNLPLNSTQKNTLVNSRLNRKEDIDISDYGKYGSLEEFDYANKNPNKYNTITQITSYDNYQTYSDEIATIKKQYTNTNDRKEAVFEYIDSLPLNKYQKTMLYKMAGGYSIKTYKNEMFNYINSLDLTKTEKENIYKELFG